MTIQRFANETGEAFLSLFTPEEMEDLLLEHGYGEIKHFGPEEAVRTYFAGRSDVRFGGAQRLICASVR